MPAGSVCTIFADAPSAAGSGATLADLCSQGPRDWRGAEEGINWKGTACWLVAVLKAWREITSEKLVLAQTRHAPITARGARPCSYPRLAG